MRKKLILTLVAPALSLIAACFSIYLAYSTYTTPTYQYDYNFDWYDLRKEVLLTTRENIQKLQESFSGSKSANGCYVMEDAGSQIVIDHFQFTAEELGQSYKDLICKGLLIPADYSAEEEA